MSKEIIINASKDRSRIAIVEDGELVELYVEHPDNVRTIGNIYLGRVRKTMSAIRASFVDIGQQQDAFLHYSDLTDNLPELLSIAAGDIPDARSLMKAPKSPNASDDDDTATADLEVETDEERRSRHRREKTKRRRGRRGGRRRGGRNRSNRSEEEEEESTPRVRRSSPYVIDLTSQPAKPKTSAPKPSAREEREDEKQASGGGKSDAPKGRSSRSRGRRSGQDTSSQDTSSQDTSGQDKADSSKQNAEQRGSGDASGSTSSRRSSSDRSSSGPRRRSQRRSRRSEPQDTPESKSDAAPDAKEAPETTSAQASGGSESSSDRAKSSRRSSGRRSGRRSQKQDAPAEAKDQGDKAQGRGQRGGASSEDDASSSRSGRRRSRRRSRGRRSQESAQQDASKSEASKSDESASKDEASSKGGGSKGRSSSSRSKSGRSRSRGRRGSGGGRSRSSGDSKQPSPRSKRSSTSSRTSADGDKGIAMVASSKRPEDYLKRDQNILVKVIKEPISNKGSRISTDISLAGRFLVLVPMADYVAVSKKIASSKERRRLRSLASSLRPAGFGVIVRTVAEGRDAKALDTDLSLLLDKWRSIEKQLRDKVKPPVVLYEDVNMVSSIIRDLFTEDFDRILIDDPRLYRNVKSYIEAVAPQMAKNVQLYKGKQGVFRSVGIERSVEEAFSPRVNMKSGGYLFIEHTEAMHVVDVNSGRAGRGKSQAQNLLDVNLEAAKEIAKQLRLRDLGGIICVDFIDMRLDSHRKKLYDTLKKEFRKDRAVTKLLPMSDFGVVQITRQRLRPSITAEGDGENGQEAAGAGEIVQSDRARREIDRIAEEEGTRVVTEETVASAGDAAAADTTSPAAADLTPDRSAAEVVSHLEAWLQHYRDNVGERHKHRPIVVRVHPFMAAFLKRGIPSTLLRWRMRMRQPRFEVDVTDDVNPLTFEVCDKKSGKDLTKKYTVAP